jgi:hypothetical protein
MAAGTAVGPWKRAHEGRRADAASKRGAAATDPQENGDRAWEDEGSARSPHLSSDPPELFLRRPQSIFDLGLPRPRREVGLSDREILAVARDERIRAKFGTRDRTVRGSVVGPESSTPKADGPTELGA